jgi:hypothetical protein
MVTEAGLGGLVGALYQATPGPVAVIVPSVEFPFATPLTAQLTVGSGCPALTSVATSCTDPPGKTFAMPEGLVATLTLISLLMVKTVLALAELLATLVAWMVAFGGAGRSWGAV